MPRTRSLAWSELKIGVIAVVALAITAVTIFTLTGSKGFFWQRYTLKTRFDNVAGLSAGAPVRVAGFEVGSVTKLEFAGEKVDVIFEVNKDQQARITTKSVAKLGSISLLGQGAVDITPATDGTPIPEFGYVPPARAGAQLSDVAEQANEGITQITELVKDIRAGKGTVGKLMTDEQVYAEMRAFVATANDVVRGMQEGKGTMGRLLKDPKAADALEASLRNLETMTKQINAGEGSIGRLLKDDTFARSLNDTTSNLKELTARLNRGDGTMGKLMTDPSVYNRLNGVTTQFDQLMTRLNEGQGTAGQLLKDKQLYENMNAAVTDLRALIGEIKKDPKKYLNMKISIF